MERMAYPDDLKDSEWDAIKSFLIPKNKIAGRKPKYGYREMWNAIVYVARSGCAWRLLPHDFPPWTTVHTQFRRWRDNGGFENINNHLVKSCREKVGRNPEPSAGVIDSQSVKKSDQGGLSGYDGGKKISGIKRHIVTDTQGLILSGKITAANIGDRPAMLDTLLETRNRLKRLKKNVG